MILNIKDLTKDITKADIEDIISCWRWCIADMRKVAVITCLGDLFFVGKDDDIYWLQTDRCELTRVANSIVEFEEYLDDEEKIDNWFSPSLIQKLIIAGKILKENEVYSYKINPVIGGDYSIENIEPVDMSVHFAFCGQICEQIKDLPDGTRVNIKFR